MCGVQTIRVAVVARVVDDIHPQAWSNLIVGLGAERPGDPQLD